MANKLSNFSDLIQKVTDSCLLHSLGSRRLEFVGISDDEPADEHCKTEDEEEEEERENEEEEEERESSRVSEVPKGADEEELRNPRVTEMEFLIGDVFEAVSAVKIAYVSLQGAHCPWDQDKMRVADVAVVAELRRLGVLRERFRRSLRRECGGGGGGERRVRAGATVREVVAPYEAVMEELKREVKVKEVEVEELREKLRTSTATSLSGGGKKQKGRTKKVNASQGQAVAGSLAPDKFEATVMSVKEASKSFTTLLLSLMRSANLDILATITSLESTTTNDTSPSTSVLGAKHAKYALESYVNRKIFQGFDHETFYMDGTLSSLLHPDQHRRVCFTQHNDMKSMEPIELLGVLPTSQFGKFCSKKYLSIVHPKMEESLFGDLEHRRQVLAGKHPRTQFYGEFLGLAKAVWQLHLLAFSMDPPPSHFEVSKEVEFDSRYMESAVRFSGDRVGLGLVVGFPVSPGFKLGNGSVIKSRVYLVPKT